MKIWSRWQKIWQHWCQVLLPICHWFLMNWCFLWDFFVCWHYYTVPGFTFLVIVLCFLFDIHYQNPIHSISAAHEGINPSALLTHTVLHLTIGTFHEYSTHLDLKCFLFQQKQTKKSDVCLLQEVKLNIKYLHFYIHFLQLQYKCFLFLWFCHFVE